MESKAQMRNSLVFILGFWTLFTPFCFSVKLSPAIFWNNGVVGAAMILSSVLALRKIKPWEEWANIILGAWLAVSPWMLGCNHVTDLTGNNIIVGLAVVILSAFALPVALTGGRKV